MCPLLSKLTPGGQSCQFNFELLTFNFSRRLTIQDTDPGERPMFDLSAVQNALTEQQLDGWLLYDFRGLNVLARRVLGLDTNAILSRRWFYFVPARGQPRKLVHRIESHALDAFPGPATVYLRWQE